MNLVIEEPTQVRLFVYRALEEIIKGSSVEFEPENLDLKDRDLFQALLKGVCRKYGYLELILTSYSNKKPKLGLQILYSISAYSILFMDRIPPHAVFSEMKKCCEKLKFSIQEFKYLHGVLKKTETDKSLWIERELNSLSKMVVNEKINSELGWSLLNNSNKIVEKLKSNFTEKEAIFSLISMRNEIPILGYRIDGISTNDEMVPNDFVSGVIKLNHKQYQEDDVVRVQGLSSQIVCAKFADKIINSENKTVRILEMSSGKGGKLWGTIAKLNLLKDRNELPNIEWVAADSSSDQLEYLTADKEMLLKIYPKLNLKILHTNFKNDKIKDISYLKNPFDFIFIDAPCTGLGTISKNPEILLKLKNDFDKAVSSLSMIQSFLIEVGCAFLKPTGNILYSVCTMTKEETIGAKNQLESRLNRKHSWELNLIPQSPNGDLFEGFYSVLI